MKYLTARNFRRYKFLRKCVRTLQMKFSQFLFSQTKVWCSDHTPTGWWPHPICTCTEEMTLNDEAKKQACATTAYSSFCVEAFAITKVSILHAGAGEKLASWTEGFSTADIEVDNFGASLTGSLAFCIHSSRLSLFCSNHLQGRHYFHGRQTVENHLDHTSTNSYHIMTSSIHHLGSIFLRFILSQKQVCRSVRENRENFPQRKFPPAKISRYMVIVWYG